MCRFKMIWTTADKNGDGSISESEFGQAIENVLVENSSKDSSIYQ